MNTAFRYFRPSIAKPHDQGSLKITASNMGGITAYVEFSDDMQTMKVAFAVCRIDENFDKSIGFNLLISEIFPKILNISFTC